MARLFGCCRMVWLQFSRNPKVAEHAEGQVVRVRCLRGASIQPQPKGRGTPGEPDAREGQVAEELQFSRNPKVAEHGAVSESLLAISPALQFSRNPKVAEHPTPERTTSTSSRSFNSAATQRSRNTPVPVAASRREVLSFNSAATQRSRNTPARPARGPRPRVLQFSRNPKVAEHERAKRALLASAAGLQFSRNPKVAEHPLPEPHPPLQPARASIQPQPKGRGTPGLLVLVSNVVAASIQPQPKGRGTPPGASPPTTSSSVPLQFSRNPKVAEHTWHDSQRDGDDTSFNSAATQRSRNTPRVDRSPSASRACFNSAATQRSRNTSASGEGPRQVS